jgi:alkylation response protein AidB-like acyl-CoA dehydrogenase
MDFDDTPEEATFRAECRRWLAANAELKARPDEVFGSSLDAGARVQAAREWQGRKAAAGFGAITWPQAMGGRGGTPIQEVIFREEEGRYRVPTHVFAVSLGMVIPSVAAHASPEVLARHIGPALHGRELWCQLLSEPGAGSDLGMVRTKAERCTDGPEGQSGWRLNGQKVWTTLAQYADFGLVLARTDPKVPKYEGLTSFFINMRAPGVEVRPIKQSSGEAEFNEVFFNDVFVPDAQRVGAVGSGWKVTLTGLMSERLSIGGTLPSELVRMTYRLMCDQHMGGAPAIADGRMRERLADLYLQHHGLWLQQCRGLTALGMGQAPGPGVVGGQDRGGACTPGLCLSRHRSQGRTRCAGGGRCGRRLGAGRAPVARRGQHAHCRRHRRDRQEQRRRACAGAAAGAAFRQGRGVRSIAALKGATTT